MIKNILTVLLTLTLSYGFSEASCFGGGCFGKKDKKKPTLQKTQEKNLDQGDGAGTQTPVPQDTKQKSDASGEEPTPLVRVDASDNLGADQQDKKQQPTEAQ